MNELEDYMDVLEGLPKEIQRDFTRIRQIESSSKRVDDSIVDIINTVLKKRESLVLDDRKKLVNKLNDAFDNSTKLAKEKLSIATRAYEGVDRQIRRLDSDFVRFDAALTQYSRSSSLASTPRSYLGQDDYYDTERPKSNRGRKKGSTSRRLNTEYIKEDESIKSLSQAPRTTTSLRSPPLDNPAYPVDPNEPTYCICGQVSYGEMIACDNDECAIKWFHIECIGLKSLPKGKWYCSECSGIQKKKINGQK